MIVDAPSAAFGFTELRWIGLSAPQGAMTLRIVAGEVPAA